MTDINYVHKNSLKRKGTPSEKTSQALFIGMLVHFCHNADIVHNVTDRLPGSATGGVSNVGL